jgi:hypothetical protein
MRYPIFLAGISAVGLVASCHEPPPAATPPPPTAAPTAAPTPTEVPTAAPAPPPPVARKECPKVTAMAATDEPFWHILAQPGGCWTLLPTDGDPERTLVIEAYDARMVGDADVARLRLWYNSDQGPTNDFGDADHWPRQVAVTKKGIWFLDVKADDQAIGRALHKAPTHVDAPRPMEPAKANNWQWIRKAKTAKGEVLCYGHETPRDTGKCEDTCDGMICVSRTGGFVVAEGTSAPFFGTFRQKGWDIQGPLGDQKTPHADRKQIKKGK